MSCDGSVGISFLAVLAISCVLTHRSLLPELISRQDRLPAITDGNNYYGEILPTRTWLNQLARRHELETERPLVQASLTRAYQSQQRAVELLFWLSCLLAAIIAAITVIQRLLKHRAIYNTREQIAADLHDELGANLHAISLCSDLASTKIHEPDQLITLFQRIHELTSRSGKAANTGRPGTHYMTRPGQMVS